jgi:hypothetical protein
MTVETFLRTRIAGRASLTQHILAELNPEAKLLANAHLNVALTGVTHLGDQNYATYSSTILSQMGLDREKQQEATEVAFHTPATLPLDDAVLAVYHHLAKMPAQGDSRREDMKERMEQSSNLADQFVELLHQFALADIDPVYALAEKLKELNNE